MQISRITKINVENFIKEMNLCDASNFIKNCELVEYYQIFDNNKIYLGFVMNDERDNKNINIIFERENITESEFLDCIDYFRKSISHNNQLYLTIYNEELSKMLEGKFRILETNTEIGYKVFDII